MPECSIIEIHKGMARLQLVSGGNNLFMIDQMISYIA
jgi:hypothetical protein